MKIKLKGTKNARDFSEFGYASYIRSAHLNSLTEKDVKVLAEKHGLKTVIDLRTDKEIAEKPDLMLPGVTYLHIPLFKDKIPGISHENEQDNKDELKKMIPDISKLYLELASEEVYVDKIKEVMDVIYDPSREGAVLWHCTEGKDRCGIISALFLLSKNIDRRYIMKDYLKTNRANFFKAWKYFLLILISGRGIKLACIVRNVFLAKREYLEPILDILEQLSLEYRKE